MQKEPETNPKTKATRSIKNAKNVTEKTGDKNKFKLPESAVGEKSLHTLKKLHASNKNINASHQQPRIPTVIDIDNVENYEKHEGDENIYKITSSEKPKKEVTKNYTDCHFYQNKITLSNATLTSTMTLTNSRLTTLSEQLCDYYLSQDRFMAFSGRVMKITENFVNLALVDEMPQRDHAKQTLVSAEHTEEQSDIRRKHLTTYQEIYDTKKPLAIKDIFTLTEEEEKQHKKAPNQVLILGQAGTGKTTLCDALKYRWAEAKKQNKALWSNQSFAAVFILRLRKLAYYKPDETTLGHAIYKECLSEQNRKNTTPEELEQAIDQWNDHGEVLFILDGYDEVATLAKEIEETPQGNLIRQLLSQPKLILTSRPHYLSGVKLDRTLENTGFLAKEIDQYIQQYYNALEKPDDAKPLIQTLKQHPASKAIMRIPINLEIMCKYWERHYSEKNLSANITLTQLYNCLIEDLSERYAEKFAGYNSMKHGSSFIDDACGLLWRFLAVLAFEQMQTDKLIIPGQKLKWLQVQLGIQSKSTEDTDFLHKLIKFGLLKPLDDSAQKDEFKKDYYFIHLTFQEFFTARYIASKLQQQEQSIIKFIQQHKYDPHYEIVWWFVAGLLKEDSKTLTFFFDILENEPRDIIGLNTNCLLVRCLEECELKLPSQIQSRLFAQFEEWIKISIYTENQLDLAFINYLALSPGIFASVISQFSALFQDENKDVRCAVVRALQNQTDLPHDILLLLSKLLLDEDKDIKCAVVGALQNQTNLPHDILFLLGKLLLNDNEEVRSTAASALQYKNDLSNDILELLINLLQDEEWVVRSAAVSTLQNQTHLPQGIFQLLVNLLLDKDWKVRNAAASALKNRTDLPQNILQLLVNLLQDENKDVRSAAASALQNRTDLPQNILQLLLNLLQDENKDVRFAVASTLENQTDLPQNTLQFLVNLLLDKDWKVRNAAASALKNQTHLPNDILQLLVNLLLDEKENVRSAAASALQNQTHLPNDILQLLVNLLLDEKKDVRFAVASTLENQTDLPQNILQFLVNLLLDKDWKVRNAAASALKNQTHLPNDILQLLVNLLLDEKENVRSAAASALQNQTHLPNDILQLLVNLLLDEKEDVRFAAASTLENQTHLPNDILRLLFNLLQDENENVKHAAISAFKNKTDLPQNILQLFIDFLQDDQDYALRYAASSTLQNKTDLPQNILQFLVDLLLDENEYVRNHAASALQNQIFLSPEVFYQLGKQLLVSFLIRSHLSVIESLSLSSIVKYLSETQNDIEYCSLLTLLVLKSLNANIPIYIDEGNHFYAGNQEPILLTDSEKNKLINSLKAMFIWLTHDTEKSLTLKERNHTPEIALSLAKLGVVYNVLEEYGQAKILFECALPILEQVYGHNHVEVNNARTAYNKECANIFVDSVITESEVLGKRKILDHQDEDQPEILLDLDSLISEQNQNKKAKIEFVDNPKVTGDYQIFGFFPNSTLSAEQEMEKMQLDYALAASKTETEKDEQLDIYEYDDDIEKQFEETKKPGSSEQRYSFNKK